MGTALVWAGAFVLIAGLAIWRGERLCRIYLKKYQVDSGEREAALLERRTAAEIASQTINEAATLEKARLALQTAEADMATSLIEATREDRESAERDIIAANRDARVDLAEEFAREDHAQQAEQDPVALYEQYLRSTFERGASYLTFGDFMRALRNS